METKHLIRQLDIIPVESLGEQINIIGAGAVGSFTALALAKMGFSNIRVFDFDKIDDENMSCQFYRIDDIGKPKVKALGELVAEFCDVAIETINDKWTGKPLNGITIAAVDSMAVREQVFKAMIGQYQSRLVIDPRMGAESMMLFSYEPMNTEHCKNYSKTLYSDDAAVQERCTAKATVYTALTISGAVCAIVKAFVCKKQVPHFVSGDISKLDFVSNVRQ